LEGAGESGAGSGVEQHEEVNPAEIRRGRPGRRSGHERADAVLQLLSGKASIDQIALRFGVQAQTVERWRELAMAGIEQSLRTGESGSPRERELARQLATLEKAFTHLAMKHELVERALRERPSRPERWPR
jgi:transposase-like protein